MLDVLPPLGTWMQRLSETSLHAGVLVGLVLLAQAVFGQWLTPRWRYALWGVVVLRLLLPVVPSSPASVWNLWSAEQAASTERPAASPAWETGVIGPPTMNEPSVSTAAPTAAVIAQPQKTGTYFNPWLLIWLTGGAAVLTRVVWIDRRLSGRVKRDAADASPPLAALFATRRAAVCPGLAVELILTDAVATPTLHGVFHPRVLLPRRLAAALTPAQLADVFDHELTHRRCRDTAANWLLVALAASHWFNPLVWFAFARLRHDREAARDAMVVEQHTPDARRAYGYTLLRVLELVQPPTATSPAAVAMSAAPRPTRQRFGHLAAHRPVGPLARLGGGLLLAGLIAVGCTGSQRGQDSGTASDSSDHAAAVNPDSADADVALPALARPIDLNLSGVSMREALDVFQQATDVKMIVRWDTINAAGHDPEARYDLQVTRISAEGALSLILHQASPPGAALDYMIRGGTVLVTTRHQIQSSFERDTRVYDIRDLLTAAPNFDPPPFDPSGRIRDDSPSADPNPVTPEEPVEQILTLIRETVGDAEEWQAEGGDRSSIRELNGHLVVLTREANHAAVLDVLGQLRYSSRSQISLESRLFLVPVGLLDQFGLPEMSNVPGEAAYEKDTRVAHLGPDEPQRIFQAVLAHPDAISVTAPRITAFNGQQAYVMLATQRAFVESADPTPPEVGGGYDITLATVEDGFTLITRATLDADRRGGMTLQLEPRLTLASLDENDVPAEPGREAQAKVQTPRVQAWRSQLAERVAPDASLLIVGPVMTGPSRIIDPKGDGVAEDTQRRPVVFVKPTLIHVDPDAADKTAEQFPGLVLP